MAPPMADEYAFASRGREWLRRQRTANCGDDTVPRTHPPASAGPEESRDSRRARRRSNAMRAPGSNPCARRRINPRATAKKNCGLYWKGLTEPRRIISPSAVNCAGGQAARTRCGHRRGSYFARGATGRAARESPRISLSRFSRGHPRAGPTDLRERRAMAPRWRSPPRVRR